MTSDTAKQEKFGLISTVSDIEADDPEAMAFLREDAVLRWHHDLAEQGGTPVGEPTVMIEANPSYGRPVYIDDEAVLDDNGEQATDHTKQYLSVVGWAVRS